MRRSGTKLNSVTILELVSRFFLRFLLLFIRRSCFVVFLLYCSFDGIAIL